MKTRSQRSAHAARPGLALALLLALACGPETADAGSDTAVEPCTVDDIQMRSELMVDEAFCTNCELARSDETDLHEGAASRFDAEGIGRPRRAHLGFDARLPDGAASESAGGADASVRAHACKM